MTQQSADKDRDEGAPMTMERLRALLGSAMAEYVAARTTEDWCDLAEAHPAAIVKEMALKILQLEQKLSAVPESGRIEVEEQWGRQERIELLELALEQYAMRPGADGEIARIALKGATPRSTIGPKLEYDKATRSIKDRRIFYRRRDDKPAAEALAARSATGERK